MLENLREVFLRFKSANLKVNLKKCSFLTRKFVTLVISFREGVATDPKKISAVKDWSAARSKKQVRDFLGFCLYYRKFVRRFSLIVKLLFELTGNQSKFV